MKRGEAVGLLKELVAEELIHPSLVLIGERSLDNYQLQIKGNYDCKEIEQLVKDRFS